MAKKMTIENLATLIQGEFSSIHDEFSNIHNEFGNIRKEFNGKFEKIDKQLFDIVSDISDMKQGIRSIERNQVSMKEVLDYHSDKIVEIDNRVNFIEKAAA